MQLVGLVCLMLPAYFANMAPPFVKYWKGWNPPISRRWLGDHKTVVGFPLGVVAGVLTSYIQSRIPWSLRGLDASNWLAVGALVLSWLWLGLRPLDDAVILAFTFVAHIIVNHIAFRLGIRDTKWQPGAEPFKSSRERASTPADRKDAPRRGWATSRKGAAAERLKGRRASTALFAGSASCAVAKQPRLTHRIRAGLSMLTATA